MVTDKMTLAPWLARELDARLEMCARLTTLVRGRVRAQPNVSSIILKLRHAVLVIPAHSTMVIPKTVVTGLVAAGCIAAAAFCARNLLGLDELAFWVNRVRVGWSSRSGSDHGERDQGELGGKHVVRLV